MSHENNLKICNAWVHSHPHKIKKPKILAFFFFKEKNFNGGVRNFETGTTKQPLFWPTVSFPYCALPRSKSITFLQSGIHPKRHETLWGWGWGWTMVRDSPSPYSSIFLINSFSYLFIIKHHNLVCLKMLV